MRERLLPLNALQFDEVNSVILVVHKTHLQFHRHHIFEAYELARAVVVTFSLAVSLRSMPLDFGFDQSSLLQNRTRWLSVSTKMVQADAFWAVIARAASTIGTSRLVFVACSLGQGCRATLRKLSATSDRAGILTTPPAMKLKLRKPRGGAGQNLVIVCHVARS